MVKNPKNLMLSLMMLVMGIIVSSAFADTTLYLPYDRSFSPDSRYVVDPPFVLQDQWTDVNGSQRIYAYEGQGSGWGTTDFRGAMASLPQSTSRYEGSGNLVTTGILDSNEGTIEFWVAPNWNGTNQGGSGIGGTGNWQLLLGTGLTSSSYNESFSIFIFNNGWPNNGGSVFFWWDWDGGGGGAKWLPEYGCTSSYSPTGTEDWQAGEWHHIAVCWDADHFNLWVDGYEACVAADVTNDQNDRPSYFDSPDENLWICGYSTNSGTSVIHTFDGKIDDVVIWDEVWYDLDSDGWSPPNQPAWPAQPYNFVDNPSFEESSDTSVAYWASNASSGNYDFYVDSNAHSGEKCLAIENTGSRGIARWYSEDIYLIEGTDYKLSCWVKTEDSNVEGRIWFPGTTVNTYFYQTPNWTLKEATFTANSSTHLEGIFLMSQEEGTVYFDDLSISVEEKPLANVIPTNEETFTEIVIPDDFSPTDYSLALEARRVLREMTGVQLDIIPHPNSTSQTGCIYINCAPDMSDYSNDLASISDEGIVLDVNDNIVCLGNTTRGVYYAVQELFYVLGCRWYTPWDGGECIPYQNPLILTYKKIVHDPSFTLRGNKTAWSYYYPPDMTLSTNHGGWLEWAARNRMNGLKGHYAPTQDYGNLLGHSAQDQGGQHNLHSIVDPSVYFSSNPEYYPLVDYNGTNERTYTTPWTGDGPYANVCVSNTNVIQICADAAIEYFDTHPFAERFHIGQMDCGPHCECTSCKALDPSGSVDWPNKVDNVLVFTDRWLWFINEIAEIVEVNYPSKYIGTFAYAETHTVPIDSNNNPRNNVMIEYCWAETNLQNEWDIVRCYKHDMNDSSCPNNVEGLNILDDWEALAPISVYSYDLYYGNGGTASSYAHHDASFYKTLYNEDVRRVSDEVSIDPLSAPLLLNLRARVLWDVNTDVNDYIDDFCDNVYGNAATPVKNYFTTLEELVSKSTETHVYFNDFDLFTASDINDLNDYLDTAESNAGSDTTLLGRIARLRVSMIYTKIKTLDPVTDADEIDDLQDEAYKLILTYNIPICGSIWGVLDPEG